MEGHAQTAEKRSYEYIQGQRSLNKVFGLTKPERWSGCKQLIDFLGDLFNNERSASTKIAKPVRLIQQYIVLVTLMQVARICQFEAGRCGVYEGICRIGYIRVLHALGFGRVNILCSSHYGLSSLLHCRSSRMQTLVLCFLLSVLCPSGEAIYTIDAFARSNEYLPM